MYLNEYGYRSGINRTMSEHLKGIAKEIESIVSFEEGDIILDIGSNDSTLLNSFVSKNIKYLHFLKAYLFCSICK